jgi:hypothetical protein
VDDAIALITAAVYVFGAAALVLAFAALLFAVHLLRAALHRLRHDVRPAETAAAEPRHDPHDDTLTLPKIGTAA